MLVTTLRQVLTGVALLMLASLTPAYSQITTHTFGRITQGAIPSAGLSAEMKRASRFTLGGAGSISSLCAYLDGNGGVSGSQNFRLALYRDNNGAPGAKVFETIEQQISSGTAARWYCIAAPVYPVTAGQYWIAIHTGGTAGVIRDYGDGAANWYGNADTYADGAATSFGAGNPGSGTLSVMAEYFSNADLRSAGRTTIGTLPSGGMTADHKRGSSFTMPERGKVYAVSAYLDGNGSTSAEVYGQGLKYIIYADANGVPGEKLYEGYPGFTVRKGQPATWLAEVAYTHTAPILDAGRYWLVLLTGATGGVARNFADGTGNWYGNADTFDDGASTPFGAGNTGNGTISAFVSYRPGDATTGVFGRTDAAATPSAGLSANVTRWSQFRFNDYVGDVTSLHAYLDGLGGGGGSQKVRMVLYQYSTRQGTDVYSKTAESAEVTIPAGMQPQWVDFPVSTGSLIDFPGIYTIAIQTSEPTGVIRDYGDTRPNPDGDWNSIPDAFEDGAQESISANYGGGYPPLPGSSTLSVYATYTKPFQ
jgi:hypothetical protein